MLILKLLHRHVYTCALVGILHLVSGADASAQTPTLDQYAAETIVEYADDFAREIVSIAQEYSEDFNALLSESNFGGFSPLQLTEFDFDLILPTSDVMPATSCAPSRRAKALPPDSFMCLEMESNPDVVVDRLEFGEELRDLADELAEEIEELKIEREEDVLEIREYVTYETNSTEESADAAIEAAFLAQTALNSLEIRGLLEGLHDLVVTLRGIAQYQIPPYTPSPLLEALEAADRADGDLIYLLGFFPIDVKLHYIVGKLKSARLTDG